MIALGVIIYVCPSKMLTAAVRSAYSSLFFITLQAVCIFTCYDSLMLLQAAQCNILAKYTSAWYLSHKIVKQY